jgi:putative (di)nucleoside polyphosphate hydrolase
VYEFPEHVRSEGKRLGQAQRWFFFRALSDEVVPTPDGVEFVAWRWVERAWLVEHVVGFRRPAYRSVLLG